jgi:hypothetical protein
MPYDDDDIFDDEFDFVDDDDDEEVAQGEEEEPVPEPPKSRRRGGAAKDKADKPAAESPKGRGRPSGTTGSRRNVRPAPEQAEPVEAEPEVVDADAAAEEEIARDEPAPEPVGPPADHVVHIYEYGKLKRTIPRKFTDEEAVSFAEEYTRTGKAYGRYAVATPEDEEPAPTFAGASRGN